MTEEKFESRDSIIETLMTDLAHHIQSILPDSIRFSLFLFQEVPEEQDVHVFYCASARTDQLLPLLEAWVNRQKN